MVRLKWILTMLVRIIPMVSRMDDIVVGSSVCDGANVLVGKYVGVDYGYSLGLANGVTLGDY